MEIIDCTLRDGEQAPGVWFTVAEKVALAELLSQAGVDLLDAGFPAASGSEKEAMQEMRRRCLQARIGATARPLRRDVMAAEAACAHEVFLFMPTSEARLKETLGVTVAEAESMLRRGAEEVLERGMALNLVLEDATRADPIRLTCLVTNLASNVPIRRLIICDTVGASYPSAMEHLFRTFNERCPTDIVLCPHAHNDFGLATANTLAAVSAGARAITCTVNGIGERAGNADLSEVVAALTHLLRVEHNIDSQMLSLLAEEVERISGIHMSAIKPITGFNVFRHESGIHVDALMKNAASYEFLPSAWVGREREYVLGKHSGGALVRFLLRQAGIGATDAQVAAVLRSVKCKAESRSKRNHERLLQQAQEARQEALRSLDVNAAIESYLEMRASGSSQEPVKGVVSSRSERRREDGTWDAP